MGDEKGKDPGRQKGWKMQTDAIFQLDQLNAMRRQQDATYWSSSAVFGVATVYLLVSILGQAVKNEYFSMTLTGFLGLVVSFFWLAVIRRANDYGQLWTRKARLLQEDFGIPSQYCIWEEHSPGTLKNWDAMVLLITGSSLIWYTFVAYACLLTSPFWLIGWVMFIALLILVFRKGWFVTFLIKVAELFKEFWFPLEEKKRSNVGVDQEISNRPE